MSNVTAIWLNPAEMCDPPASVAGKVVITQSSGGGCVATTIYERLARLEAKALVALTPMPAAGVGDRSVLSHSISKTREA